MTNRCFSTFAASFSTSFFSDLKILLRRYFTSLGILFALNFCNDILTIWYHSWPVCYWYIERLLTFLYINVYSATLLKMWVRAKNFWVESLGSFKYRIKTSVNHDDDFTCSFPICIPFISLSCLIALAKPSNTILHNARVNTHFCYCHQSKCFSY